MVPRVGEKVVDCRRAKRSDDDSSDIRDEAHQAYSMRQKDVQLDRKKLDRKADKTLVFPARLLFFSFRIVVNMASTISPYFSIVKRCPLPSLAPVPIGGGPEEPTF
ncbi:unnamed protein product [Enterobius vermicularis]|uniref:IBB domain-containing protein n=1 Tax=Enterobius vermicularis TaxID=51028 RepID=A0A0N4V030_ENTVE|nr:unnamed protein product [Enterobius vermicularis]